MKDHVPRIILAIVLIVGLACSWSEAQNSNTFVFAHANVVPMNKEIVLSDYSVVVKEGRIKEIGLSSSIEIPQGATVIDARGKFMIPALSDMHVHLEGDAWNIMFPPEKNSAKAWGICFRLCRVRQVPSKEDGIPACGRQAQNDKRVSKKR